PANAGASGKPVSIRCPKCGTISRSAGDVALPPVAPPRAAPRLAQTVVLNERPSMDATGVIGWLVVHDENTTAQTFPLREGRNVVGRWSENKPADVMIATQDPYMSRNHSVIEVIRLVNGPYQYLISDCGSTNGTFINANPDQRLSAYDQVYLYDGDTIQMGRTKVVIKTGQSALTSTQAGRVVGQHKYLKTIIV
ncbi:MAG: FHA domain-containing protein, partial [Rudanella sp.]|nr:FHA domain-containing protein [Rudanella sp.]